MVMNNIGRTGRDTFINPLQTTVFIVKQRVFLSLDRSRGRFISFAKQLFCSLVLDVISWPVKARVIYQKHW